MSETLRLPTDAVVRFVGDLHLGDGAPNDAFGASDSRLVEFLHECEKNCDAVVFMGDTFDLPQAFRLRRILRAHSSLVQAMRTLCSRTRVFFILGNHDWNLPFERIFPGARACEELWIGDARILHGHQLDRYCHPGLPLHRAKITLHHLAERLFGFMFRVPLHAHDTWQNRVGHWLGCQYGRYLRRRASIYRFLGLQAAATECESFLQYWSRTIWGDPSALFEPAREYLRTGECQTLVLGHTHMPGVVDLGGNFYVNAGSWTFGTAQYASWDGKAFRALDWVTGDDSGDRHYRWMIDGPDPGDFFTWWRLNYRGWMRFRRLDPSLPALSIGRCL